MEDPTDHSSRGPPRRPPEGQVSTRQEHETGIRELKDGRVSDGVAEVVSGVRRIGQIAQDGGPVSEAEASEAAQAWRMGRGADQAACLGQGGETDQAPDPAWRSHVKKCATHGPSRHDEGSRRASRLACISGLAPEQLEERALLDRRWRRRRTHRPTWTVESHWHPALLEVGVQNSGVNVARARHGGRVAEPVCGLAHRGHDGPARVGDPRGSLGRLKGTEGEDGRGPCPEVLGAEGIVARGAADVLVHGLGIHLVHLAVQANVLEELLAWQVLAAPDDRREAAVDDVDLADSAGLAAAAEPNGLAPDARVAVLEGRQPERSVEARVLLVPDPEEGQLQQPDHGGRDLLAGEASHAEIVGHPPANPRQPLTEANHPLELVDIASIAEPGVVAVLLPSAGVAARGLEVAVCNRADPDVGPRRGNGQRPDPSPGRRIGHAVARRLQVFETGASTTAGNPWIVRRDVAKTG